MGSINDGSGLFNGIFIYGGIGNGIKYISDILKEASLSEVASLSEEALRSLLVEGERQKMNVIKFQEMFTDIIQDVNYKPSIQELKKYLKYEKNPMRQLQLKRDIAKMERENSKK